jgi:hypothetical protein
MPHRQDFEVLRSGFLADGRFYSVEVERLRGGVWGAWLVCVPGETTRAAHRTEPIKRAERKDQLQKWAQDLKPEEIEDLAGGCCA